MKLAINILTALFFAFVITYAISPRLPSAIVKSAAYVVSYPFTQPKIEQKPPEFYWELLRQQQEYAKAPK